MKYKAYYKIINKDGDAIGKIRIKASKYEAIEKIKNFQGKKTWHKITWWSYITLKILKPAVDNIKEQT